LVVSTGLNEYYSNFANIGHNDLSTLAIYWVVPNGAWIVFPSYFIYELGSEIVASLEGRRKVKQ
jgi:hypothetical protein